MFTFICSKQVNWLLFTQGEIARRRPSLQLASHPVCVSISATTVLTDFYWRSYDVWHLCPGSTLPRPNLKFTKAFLNVFFSSTYCTSPTPLLHSLHSEFGKIQDNPDILDIIDLLDYLDILNIKNILGTIDMVGTLDIMDIMDILDKSSVCPRVYNTSGKNPRRCSAGPPKRSLGSIELAQLCAYQKNWAHEARGRVSQNRDTI